MHWKAAFWAVLVVSLDWLFQPIWAFTNGAPCKAAWTAKLRGNPQGHSGADTPAFSMQILAPDGSEAKSYNGGIIYDVKITTTTPFRAFILQPRFAQEPSKPFGHFRNGFFIEQPDWNDQGIQFHNCPPGFKKDAVTHLNNRVKQTLLLKWIADNLDSPVQFTLSLVQKDSYTWNEWAPSSGFLRPENVTTTQSPLSTAVNSELSTSPIASRPAEAIAPQAESSQTDPSFLVTSRLPKTRSTSSTTTASTTTSATNERTPEVIIGRFSPTDPFQSVTVATDGTSTSTPSTSTSTTTTPSTTAARQTTGAIERLVSANEFNALRAREDFVTRRLVVNLEPGTETVTSWPPVALSSQSGSLPVEDISFDPRGRAAAIATHQDNIGGSSEVLLSSTRPKHDYCQSSPCRHGTNCSNAVDEDDYFCRCTPGWVGKDCEARDFCLTNPCRNDGTCINDHDAERFKCDCKPGWSGDVCDKVCPTYLCQNGGTCVFDNGGAYNCACKPGWTGKGCDRELNECESNPCKNGGACADKFNGFSCTCAPGFDGELCERPCIDVYKSCERWKGEDRCEANKHLTRFFDVNCAVTCNACKAAPPGNSIVYDYPPFPPALDAFHWLAGTWVTNATRAEHFPLDFINADRGYSETISFLTAEVPMFGTPSINYSVVAINNRNPLDVQLTYGFLTLKRSPSINKTAALMSTSNNGAIIIEEGAVLPEKHFMELKSVYNAALPYIKWRLPAQSTREFRLIGAQLRVRTHFLDKDLKVQDFQDVYTRTSGRNLY